MHLEKKTTVHHDGGTTHVNARLQTATGIDVDISMFPSSDNLSEAACKAKVEKFCAALLMLSKLF